MRGLGSFYYLAFALGQAEFEGATILWVTVCFAVLSSIVMHGVMVTPGHAPVGPRPTTLLAEDASNSAQVGQPRAADGSVAPSQL